MITNAQDVAAIKELEPAVIAVWNAIAPDLDGGDEMTPDAALECCLDADHLAIFHSEEANAQLRELLTRYSLDEIIEVLITMTTLL